MIRVISALILCFVFQAHNGFCGFTLDAPGFAAKRLVECNNGVMATDGKTFLVMNAQGEKLGAAAVNLDYTYLLQAAVYSDGAFYMLYQHNDGNVRFAVLSLNNDLSIRWLKDYEQVGSTFGYAMAAADDGGVAVAGRSCISGFFVCSIDAAGQLIWNNTYAAGDNTAIPGALLKTANGYTLAYKRVAGDSYYLGMMSLDMFGYVNACTATEVETNFYIKGLTNTDGGCAALVQEPGVSTNSIVTFNQALQAQHVYPITSTKSLQTTGLAYANNLFYVSGNALQPGTANLDLMYASIDPMTLSTDALSVASGAYDDAFDVKQIGGKIWIGGVISGNAHVASFGNLINKPCSFETLDMSVNENAAVSTNANAGFSYGVSIDPFELTCNASFVSIAFTNQCNTLEETTNVEPTSIENPIVELYPNPNNGTFTVTFHQVDASEIFICDAIGRVLAQQIVTEKTTHINLGNTPAGTYVLVAKDVNGALLTRRFVLAR